jgi:hypothetical protein
MKQMTNLLGLYGGCDNDELRRIRKLPSRWVALCTTFPSLVIYEGGCYLLHADAPCTEKGKMPFPTLKRSGAFMEAPQDGKKAKTQGAGNAEDDEEDDGERD